MRFLQSIWAVARQTFTQCLRSKVGGVFFVLLALVLLVTPMLNSDAHVPLADRVRTFLSYSLGASTVLMCIVTVFLTTGIVSADVEKKQVFILIVKPLAKWQYILGRWLGVVLLDVLLVAVSGAAIYAIALYMRSQPPISALDRRTLETEVFAARRKIAPDYAKIHEDIEKQVDDKIEESRKQGSYAKAVQSLLPMVGGDSRLADQRLRDEFRKQFMEKHQSVEPGKSLKWVFKGIEVEGESISGVGTVVEIDRDKGVIVILAPKELLSLIMAEMPVNVAGVEGVVAGEGRDRFAVRFYPREMAGVPLVSLTPQSRVDLRVDPVLQITYKPTALTETGGNSLRSTWFLTPAPSDDPNASPPAYREARVFHSDASGLPTTIVAPARLVEKGRLQAVYLNEAQPFLKTTVSIREEDITLLYRVGSFEMNFLKGLAMVLVQLMFIAALGVFAGSFLGFAVAALMVLVLVVFGLAQDYIQLSASSMDAGVFATICRVIIFIMSWLIPNIGALSPSSSLVGGLMISWSDWIGIAPIAKTLIGSTAILSLACAIYHKRELARVQV